MPREIAGHDAIPPPLALLEAGRGRAHQPPAARIVKHGDRHPLAHHDQIQPAVAVHVAPHGVRHHPDPLQLGCEPFGHIGEVTVPVVLEQHARGIDTVAPWDHAPAHEEVEVTVAIVVGRRRP